MGKKRNLQEHQRRIAAALVVMDHVYKIIDEDDYFFLAITDIVDLRNPTEDEVEKLEEQEISRVLRMAAQAVIDHETNVPDGQNPIVDAFRERIRRAIAAVDGGTPGA